MRWCGRHHGRLPTHPIADTAGSCTRAGANSLGNTTRCNATLCARTCGKYLWRRQPP